MATNDRPGATPGEWAHFSLALGLTADLLPVVSRAGAQVSAGSTLKSIGKTPSRYTAEGKVVGIARWTAIHANDAQVDLWSRQRDYGICLQSRTVRGIDIDCDDLGLVGTIRAHIGRVLGVSLPSRGRAGSARVLLAVHVDGAGAPVGKQVIRLADGRGLVEFLGDGQQFIAAGTHIDRHGRATGRYRWEDGMPASIPRISLPAYLELIASLDRYGDRLAGSARARRAGAGAAGSVRGGEPDAVLRWLDAGGWLRAEHAGGDPAHDAVAVHCPWSEAHSGDSGPTETVYWPAGTGGYERGHFKCLHAHCVARTDEDFLDAVGYYRSVAHEISALDNDAGLATDGRTGVVRARPVSAAPGAPVGGAGDALPGVWSPVADDLPDDPTALWVSAVPGAGLARSRRGFLPTPANVLRALLTPGYWRRVAYDTFRDELVWCAWRGANAGQWRPWRDADLTLAQVQLERDGFEPPARDVVRNAVELVALERAFDSAQLWLDRLQWDGLPRVDTFLERYAQASVGDRQVAAVSAGGTDDDGPRYLRAVSAYLWTALAARVLDPGHKTDMVPILVGAQGVGKTSLVSNIAPAPDFAVTIDLSARDADLARRLRGRLVVEIAELRGLHTRDRQSINDFVTAREDVWTPKYKEFAVRAPRRFVMVGTTNDEHFLADETGNRRWLPLRVGQVDLDALIRDRGQLWAEAADRYVTGGVEWADAERLARLEHAQYMMEDGWSEIVDRWSRGVSAEDLSVADGVPRGAVSTLAERGFTVQECLQGALGFVSTSTTRSAEMRCAAVLRGLGFAVFRERRGGSGNAVRVWRVKSALSVST